MIIEGIMLGIIFALGLVFLVRGLSGRNNQTTGTGLAVPVQELAYCNDTQTRPCVVSFGIDANEKTLVNLLLPDLSFPNFYLKIIRDGVEASYHCQRIASALNNAYCVGEKMPPGELLHLMLISNRDNVLLAEGRLSIIGLAFPTMEVVTPTGAPNLTETPDFISSTPTPPVYPNPIYP
jgi:hypothetical protein